MGSNSLWMQYFTHAHCSSSLFHKCKINRSKWWLYISYSVYVWLNELEKLAHVHQITSNENRTFNLCSKRASVQWCRYNSKVCIGQFLERFLNWYVKSEPFQSSLFITNNYLLIKNPFIDKIEISFLLHSNWICSMRCKCKILWAMNTHNSIRDYILDALCRNSLTFCTEEIDKYQFSGTSCKRDWSDWLPVG